MGDPDTIRFLQSIRIVAKDAQTIANETGVPLSSVYRKLAMLKGAGLIYMSSFRMTAEGKRQDLFLCAVTEVKIEILGDQVGVELIPTQQNATRIWFELFRS
jgi:hypothetical protein